jgi:hypothetical protein
LFSVGAASHPVCPGTSQQFTGQAQDGKMSGEGASFFALPLAE